MTIKDYILEGTIKSSETRLEKLKEMGAPGVMITSLEQNIEELKNGVLKIGGDVDVLDEEFIDREFKTGNGGKQYICINGSVNFFPNARYGMYIKRG